MIIKEIFEQLEDSTSTGCWHYNVKNNYIWWSKKTYEIHGVDENEVVTSDLALNFYHPDDREAISEHFRKCVEDGVAYKDKLRIYDVNGVTHYVEITGKALRKDGVITYVFGTFKDITREVQKDLIQNEIKAKYNHYFEVLDNFFIIAETNKAGVITYVNQRFCEISGYSKEELIGKTHRIVNSKEHPKGFFKEIWNTIQEGKPWEGTICNRNKKGELYWVQSLIFPTLSNEGGGSESYIAIRFDVTDKMKLDNELALEREKLEVSSQLAAVGEVSAGIAHEIANPLTIIEGNVHRVVNATESVPEEAKVRLQKALVATERINKIIKGLHYLAQQSRHGEYLKHDLRDIIERSFDFCKDAFRRSRVELIYDKPEDVFDLKCDDIKISQIILNLINNARDAVKALPEKWVKIDISQDAMSIWIDVIDSGSGIPDEVADKLFTTFYTTKEAGKGTGLGLSLVQKFVIEHNGTIHVVKESPNTHFRVKIPKIQPSIKKATE